MSDLDRAVVRIWRQNIEGNQSDKTYLGTAFLISPRHLVTCAHVLNDDITKAPLSAEKLYVQGLESGGGFSQLGKVFIHPRRDIALLELPFAAPEHKISSIPFSNAKLAVKHRVTIKGYATSHRGIETPELTIDSYAGEQVTYTAHTSIGKGMSGGPVLLNEELVGVVQARDTNIGQTHIIPLLEFQTFLEEYISKDAVGKINIMDSSQPSLSNLFELIDNLFQPLFYDTIDISLDKDFSKEFRFLSFILQHQDCANTNYIELDHFLRILLSSPSTVIAQIHGEPGTGKSTLLSITNTCLRLLAQSNKSEHIPIYIDANQYFCKQKSSADCINQLRSDLAGIAKACNHNKVKKIFILIDGISLLNTLSDYVIRDSILQFGYSNISGVLVALEDKYELETFIKEDSAIADLKDNYNFETFILNKFATDRSDIDEFLQAFVDCQNKVIGKSIQDIACLSYLKGKLATFEIDEIDVHTLHLLYHSCGNKDYKDCRTIGEFLRTYCEKELELASIGAPTDNDEFFKVAKLAYRLLKSSLSESSKTRLSRFMSSEKTGKPWKLIHSHTNIRDFLAANYIVNSLADANRASYTQKSGYDTIIKEGVLEIDSPNNVNRFVKSIINSNEEISDKVFNSISGLLDKKEINALTQNYLFYLLGRFEIHGVKKQATDLLLKYKIEHIKKVQQPFLDDDKRILDKARLRTIFVSLAYLEHAQSVREYVDILLTDHESASINRGYHLIYYGDIKEGGNVEFSLNTSRRYLDIEDASWSATFESLIRGLRKHIQAKREHRHAKEIRIFDIRLVSLSSFAQSRMLARTLTEEQNLQIKDVINKVLDLKVIENAKLEAYVRSVAIDLARPDYVNWAFILDIYRLKSTPRQGWLNRKAGEFDEMKHVETVADHTHLAFLLAYFLLPPDIKHPEYPNFSKKTITSMILMHDIAEIYIGDKVIRELSPDQKKQYFTVERQAMEYIMTRETYCDSPKIYDTIDLYSEWFEFNNTGQEKELYTNAKLAKDIDRLENFIQLWIYKERISTVEFDSFRERLFASFKTPYVMDLAKSFDKWCLSGQHQKVLSTPLSVFQDSLSRIRP